MGDREIADIESRFTPRPLTSENRQVHAQIMFSTKDLAEFVLKSIPAGRERASALTKLEEFGFWCERGLVTPLSS